MKIRFFAALLAAAVPAAATGQELARRIGAVEDGTVRLTYPPRSGVEICDHGIRMGEERVMWHGRSWRDYGENCRAGPVEVEVVLRAGSVRSVDLVRRPGDRTPDALDLGAVSATDAADYFLEVARTGGGNGRGEEDAVFPLVLADVADVWRDLLALARDRQVDGEVRTAALFWVGREAADAATEGLAEVARDEDEDHDVREAAVFALSQRPHGEGVPILMDLARTAGDPETRRNAMFWLAQSGDERVYAFFEEILLRRGGG